MTKEKKPITNPVKAIRAYCLSCVGGSSNEVDKCPISECPLHSFRHGKNPFRTKRELTDEQKAAMAERLKKARDAKSSGEAQ